MSAKTALSRRNSFITCSEDMFEGFIRERLNSSTEDDADEEMETEKPMGNDLSEVVGEESSADSNTEIKDSSDKDGEKSSANRQKSIDNTSDKNKPSAKSIVVSREKLNLKSYFNKTINENPVISKPKSINIVKKLPVFREIAPKPSHTPLSSGSIKLTPTELNNGFTKLSPIKSNSGIFLVNTPKVSPEGGSTKNAKEVIKKLVLLPQKNLVTNESKSRKRKEIESRSGTPEKDTKADNNELIPIKKQRRIVFTKTLISNNSSIQGADRKSLDISGISLCTGSFNGLVSKKVEVNMAASLLDSKINPEARKSIEYFLEGSTEQNNELATTSKVVPITIPDTQTFNFKKPVQINQLNGHKALVAKKPISFDSATQKKLLSLMKSSGDDKVIYVSNSAIRFKPISEHSVQCVIDKNGLVKEQIVMNSAKNADKLQLIQSKNARVTVEPKTQRIILHGDGQQPDRDDLNSRLNTKENVLVSLQGSNQHFPSVLSSDVESTVHPSSKQMNETSTNTSELEIASSSTSAPLHSDEKDLSEMYMDQLTNPAVPNFEPPPPQPNCSNLLACVECKDKFTQQSSLDFHRARRSVLIGYWCCVCGRRLSFFNRCAFLRHLRGHNQELCSLDVSCLSIEPIPRHLIKFGNSYANQSSSNVTHQIIKKVPVTSSDSVVTNPTPTSKGNTSSTQMNLVCTKSLDVSEDVLNQDIEEEVGELIVNEQGRDVAAVEKVAPVEVLPKLDVRNVTDSTNKVPDVNEIETDAPSVLPTIVPSNRNDNNARDPKSLKLRGVKRVRSCPECKLALGRAPLQKHILNDNRPSNPCLRCNDCNLILPTRCSLRMHLRMHIPIKPYRCPECGIEYHIYERFMMHLKFECCHLAKAVKYMCTLCNVPEPSLSRLRVHVLDFHTRRIIKCNHCRVAFLHAKMIFRHHQTDHANIEPSSTVFSQCRFCPGKLIPQKRFANHVAKHITSDKFKIYVYECYQCKECFIQRKDLIEHSKTCGNNGNGNDVNGGNGSGSNGVNNVVANNVSRPSNPTGSVLESNYVEVEGAAVAEAPQADNVIEIPDEVEMLAPVRESLTVDDEVEMLVPVRESLTVDDEVSEQDPLSLEGFRVEEQPVDEPKIEMCVLCKRQQVVIQPGENAAQQSLCCRDCVQPCNENDLQPRRMTMTTRRKTKTQTIYRCKLCNYLTIVDFDVLVRHFRRMHKTVSDAHIKHFVAIEMKNIYHSIRSKTVSAAESIKDKYLKKKKPCDGGTETFTVKEEQIEIDDNDDDESVANEKSPKKKSPPKPISGVAKAKSIPASPSGLNQFDRGLVMPSKPVDNNLKCSKCDFKAQRLPDLRAHVTEHRTDPSALQCLDCGECFVVLPSLEKHLAIRHRILDVDKYIADNPTCVPPDSSLDSFKCSVCQTMFDSRHALDKHFRIHGMAFLKQTRPIS